MTRETKIGLLVGLAFIIVIGILLSDHLTSSTEPPQAALANAGSNVRQAVTTPGQPGPTPAPVTPPANTAPQNPVPTQNELAPKPDPIQIVKVGPGSGTREMTPAELRQQQQPTSGTISIDSAQPPQDGNAQPSNTSTTTSPQPANDQPDSSNTSVAGADAPTITKAPPVAATPIESVARQHGEEVVSLTPDGRASRTTTGATGRTANGMAEYKADAGDTVSRLAAKFLGANTKANRDLIIAANPSLKDNPDKIIVGRTYMIPTSVAAAAAPAVATNATAPVPAPMTNAQPAANTTRPATSTDRETGEYWYTVKEGDSLWRIAKEQLGKASAVAALKELNKDVLGGPEHDQILVGSKIRLPSKPIATASSN
jgi:nucleoid-associated protein YgaU